MNHSDQTTRRTFMRDLAATGATLATGLSSQGARQDEPPPQEEQTVEPPPPEPEQKVRLAYIGTDGIGRYHLNTTKDLGVVCPCFCDVDTAQMEEAAKLFPDAKRYQDYREMFEKEANNFDAVMIGVPDHHHYPATLLAMQLGKHVYTQKPLTHTPWEARKLTEAAGTYKVATQMGNQGHAKEGWRLVYEWIHGGALGVITEVHSWTNRPIWPQGMERPKENDAVPGTLNWDVWLGPAPERPYKTGAYHRFNWRGWWDFGAGALGDMACHTMDGLFWAMDPGYPTAVEPLAATPATEDAFPKSTVVKWEFPAKGERPAFNAYWYDGALFPPFPMDLEIGRRLPETGNLFLGTKASLLVSGDYGDSPRIIPESRMKEIGKPERTLERSPGHVEEWIMACRGEKPIDYPKSNFAYAGPFSETVLLGNVALRMGRRLEWDGPNMLVTNVPEANQYLTKRYRKGWKF